MKKALLLSILSFVILATNQLTAYCVYNYSPNPNDTITVFTYSKSGVTGVLFTQKARYVLAPEKDITNPQHPGCWNWKEIDKNNPKKEWFFRAYKGKKIEGTTHFDVIATGYFPIGGAIAFFGYQYGKPKFKIYYDGTELKEETKNIKTF